MRKTLIAFALGCILTGCGAQKTYNSDMVVVAHRGGASLGIENSLSCIEKGIATGADMIEIDVHMSLDGALVVCHDPTIDRTTTGKGAIREMTLEQLRSYPLKHQETGEVAQDERLPLLEEVLDAIRGRCGLLLEVKRGSDDWYPGIEKAIIDAIEAAGVKDQVVVQSFNDSVLRGFHSLDASIPLEKLIVTPLPFGLWLDTKIHAFDMKVFSYVQSVNAYHAGATRGFINRMHAKGKKVKVWTVNKLSDLPEGVDGVITNDPALFINR